LVWVWVGALQDTGSVTATDYLWLEQELVNNSKDNRVSQIQLVNIHKLHLVNKIIYSQAVFDSILIIVSNTMGMAHLRIKNC